MARSKKTFAEALEQLERIVAEVESGEVSLEDSIDKYAEGVELIKQCQTILDAAEKKIQLLAKGKASQLEAAGELPETDRQ